MSVIRAVLICCLCSVLFAGCGGTELQSPSPTGGEGLQSRSPANRATNQSASARGLPSRNVLYVSDPIHSRVDIYPLNSRNPAPIGETATDTPTGMAIDSSHDLYVALNANNVNASASKRVPDFVTMYAPGDASPRLSYWQDLRSPTDVVVGSDGTVYVAGFGDGNVTEYPPGSTSPSLHFRPASGSAIAVALDSKNNLYVACAISNVVFEYPPGSTVGTNLNLLLGGEPHGMAFDGSGNLLVAVSSAPKSGSVIDVFLAGHTSPSQQIGGVFQPFMIDFDRGRQHLYVADYGSGNHDGAVFEFAYPSGTLVNKYTQGAASAAYGIAVNPPASL